MSSVEARLRRGLGFRDAVVLGIGGTIGCGIFVLVGDAASRAGPAVLLAFVLAFIAALVIALPYAEATCRRPSAGGGYMLVQQVLGRRWGVVMGWGTWGIYLFGGAFVALGFGGYLHELTGAPERAGGVGLVAACTCLNLTGAQWSGRLQTWIVALALVALLGFGVAGAFHVHHERLLPFAPNGAWGVLVATLLAFLAFAGFDIIAASAEEIERPERNLPAAILVTLAVALGVYLLVTYVAIGVIPWRAIGDSQAPIGDAAHVFLGARGEILISLAALLTTAGTTNALLVAGSRVGLAMAREGLLPAGVARLRAGGRVPAAAVLVCGAVTAAIAARGSILLAADIYGFLYVMHLVLPLAALVVLRRRGGPAPKFAAPAPAVLLPLALAFCAVLMAASGGRGVVIGLAWLAAGLITTRMLRRYAPASARDAAPAGP